MKISVIVPYHEEERYISDCLISLEEQTFRDFEVILVKDHCTVTLPEVSYEIREFELTDKSGVAAARNLGLSMAKGEYVYFLDCDDYVERDAFSLLVHSIEESSKGNNNRTDIVFGSIHETWYKRQVYYENGKELDAMNGLQPEANEKAGERTGVIRTDRKMDTLSVHSALFCREFLEKNKLRFSEEFTFMSDYPFIIQALSVAGKNGGSAHCDESIYIQRKHNDPINLPSLLQTKEKKKKIIECIRAYEVCANLLSGKDRNKLAKQFIFHLASVIAPYYIECPAEERNEIFAALTGGAVQIPEDVIAKEKRYHKGLLCAVKKSKPEALLKKMRFRAGLQTLKRVLISRAQLKKFLYRKVFAKQKMLNDTVLLESFFGKSYSDSPKYIFEYLNKNFPGKYKYVWILNEKKKLPFPAKQIKRFSFRYFYYLARCKYIVFNSRQPVYFIKREGNVFLETWHGTPLKKLVFDMEEVTTASPLYKEQFYIQTRSWDYLVAPNEFSAEIFGHAFMYDGPLLKTGYPRNDILYREDKEEIAAKIKDKLHIPQDKKVALYAPTWRDDEFYGSGKYKFTLKLELDKMKERLGKEWVVLLRTHYFVADFLDVTKYGDFVYNVSKYDDIAELYLISDVLITDYSSVFFDYANLRRPMLFYTYDLEKYRDVLRGFYINMEEEIPGPLLFTTEEVMKAMENLPAIEQEYQEKYRLFCDKFCDFEDGHATENIVNTVFNS